MSIYLFIVPRTGRQSIVVNEQDKGMGRSLVLTFVGCVLVREVSNKSVVVAPWRKFYQVSRDGARLARTRMCF